MHPAEHAAGPLGAVLVGGQSRRMGRPKALIDVDGVAMARRVAAAMLDAGCDRVVGVGPAELSAGLVHVPDRYPGEGPLGGILTALQAARGEAVLVAACDLPFLDGASLAALLAADGGQADVVVARSDRLEPLCALWRPSSRAALQAAFDTGERAVHRAMASLVVFGVPLAAEVLTNVNTPDDLLSE